MRPFYALLPIAALLSGYAQAAVAGGTVAGKVTAKAVKHKKNAVVFIEKAPGAAKPVAVQMDQRNQLFVPFVQPVVAGSTVEFLNNDATGHNVFSPDGETFDLGVFDKGQSKKFVFAKEGVYTILCKMHPSMIAYVLSLQNAYFAVTGEDGAFKIEDVPPGEYTLKVWHERKKGSPVKVVVAEGAPVNAEIELK